MRTYPPLTELEKVENKVNEFQYFLGMKKFLAHLHRWVFIDIKQKTSQGDNDQGIWSIPEVGPTIWHDSAPDDAFDKPGYPEDYAKANNQKRGY